jgi:NhaP-type Na+/H+ or K+/H+ antiporter
MHQVIFQDIGIILLSTILCQWVAWRLRFPVIILLTLFGLLLGPILDILHTKEVFGDLLNPLIELVVAVILFEGGLSLKIHEFKKVTHGLIRLFTLSIIVQVSLIAWWAYRFADFDFSIAIVLGCLLIVTGPTVIIPALREARLKPRVSHYLKWEGIVNDPIGAMLAIITLQIIIHSNSSPELFVVNLFKGNLVAFLFSFVIYKVITWMSQRALIPEFLKIPSFLGLVLIQFVFANYLQQGAGLLAVTLFGILIGNSGLEVVHELRKFKESLTTFSVSIIFIILASTLEISDWTSIELKHMILVFMISFIIRPLSIYISTIKSGMTFKEQALIGLYGPKGIVAASVAGIIGIELTDAGFREGHLFLPIVFSVIILTVIIHSFALKPLAKFLSLTHTKKNGVLIVGASPFSVQLALKLKEIEIPVMISDATWNRLSNARQAGIDVHYGQILTDRNHDEPDLTSYNYLLAMTDDNSYNVLLCQVLGHDFGTDHVYSLPSEDDFFSDTKQEEKNLLKFKEKPLYLTLLRLFHYGHIFKVSELTDEYEYDDFLNDHMCDELLPILIIRENGRIEFYSGYNNLKPTLGDRIIYYTKADEASRGSEASS